MGPQVIVVGTPHCSRSLLAAASRTLDFGVVTGGLGAGESPLEGVDPAHTSLVWDSTTVRPAGPETFLGEVAALRRLVQQGGAWRLYGYRAGLCACTCVCVCACVCVCVCVCCMCMCMLYVYVYVYVYVGACASRSCGPGPLGLRFSLHTRVVVTRGCCFWLDLSAAHQAPTPRPPPPHTHTHPPTPLPVTCLHRWRLDTARGRSPSPPPTPSPRGRHCGGG